MFNERNFRDSLLTDDNIDLIFGKKNFTNFNDVDWSEVNRSIPCINELMDYIYNEDINLTTKQAVILYYYERLIDLKDIFTLKILELIASHSISAKDKKDFSKKYHKTLDLVSQLTKIILETKYLLFKNKEQYIYSVELFNKIVRVLSKEVHKITGEGVSSFFYYNISNPFKHYNDNMTEFTSEAYMKNHLVSQFKSLGFSCEPEFPCKYGRIDILLNSKYCVEVKTGKLTNNDLLQVMKYTVDNDFTPIIIGKSIGTETLKLASSFGISVYIYDILEHHPMVKLQLSCKNDKIVGEDLDKYTQPQRVESIDLILNEDIELGVEIIRKLLDSFEIELGMSYEN